MDILQILSDQKEELLMLPLESLVKRKEEDEIQFNSKLVQVVIGVRRSGKSTLCQQALLRAGLKFAYVNFDDERLAELKTEQLDELLQALYRLNGVFSHLFLDEIQNIKGWQLFVNRLLRQGLHLILTGSNANLLSGELATYLTGRYHQIELFPFSLKEICVAQNVDTTGFSTKAKALRLRAFDEYLQKGGFPELMNTAASSDYIHSLLNAIVNKDIVLRYKIRYKETLWRLANIVLDRFCQEFSAFDLARTLNVGSSHTIENYLQYLANAYLIRPVHKFSFKSDERKMNTKYYAIDMAFVSQHDDTLQTQSMGWRLENIIYIELERRINPEHQHIYYLRKERDFEVDFIITDHTNIKELIQVTYDFSNPSVKQYNREVGGLIKGAKMTHCQNLTLISMTGPTDDIVKDDLTIHCVHATDWLLQ